MPPSCRLYLITPPAFDATIFAGQLEKALQGGDVACLQLRLKSVDETAVDDALIVNAAQMLMPICAKYNVQFILNDSPHLAKQLNADGVHVGEKDGSAAQARSIIGENKIVGCSCYDSSHRAMEAGEQDADYVAFGAFYPTQTKKITRHPHPDILKNWSRSTTVPCVAIGGITPKNLAPLVRSGADFIAVVTGIWNHPDGPKHAVAAYNNAISAASSH